VAYFFGPAVCHSGMNQHQIP